MSEWIKCSERMPTQDEQLRNGVLVLVYCPGTRPEDTDDYLVYLAHFQDDMRWHTIPDDDELLPYVASDDAVVTHWMPVPELPK